MLGDPDLMLEQAGERLYGDAAAVLPDVGEVSIEFDFGEDARALAAEVEAFFEANLTPELRARAHYSFDGHVPEFHKKLAEARLTMPGWPEEFGGRNASAYATNLAYRSWEKYNWSTHAVGTTSMVGYMIRKFGSDELKEEVLTRIVAGDCICSLGFSEPSSGSDVFAAKTRATQDGNGWRIDGSKMFTSGANMADYVLMLTRTDPEFGQASRADHVHRAAESRRRRDTASLYLSGRAHQHHLLRWGAHSGHRGGWARSMAGPK